MTKNKHIALWVCPRSRSTVITKAFQQLEGCVIFDEPLCASYLLTQDIEQPYRQGIIDSYETNHKKVIQKITGPLPENASFSFQKHMAKHVLPEFGTDWLKLFFQNVFMIRNPKEIILSYYQISEKITLHDIGIVELYNLFKKVEAFTGKIPLVIDSTDFIREPRCVLKGLCSKLNITFSEKMLNWKPGLKGSNWLWSPETLSSFAPTWYSTVMNSSGFIPYNEVEINLPDELKPLEEKCLPFYEELYQYRTIFS